MQELERFHLGVQEGHLRWHIMQTKTSPTVTDRYSHCACYHRKLLYVFGGCASTCTTFNDLWCLNLSRGEWIRPLTSGLKPFEIIPILCCITGVFLLLGVYPSPTACATLVSHNDQLILFGGWCHPTPNTFYQVLIKSPLQCSLQQHFTSSLPKSSINFIRSTPSPINGPGYFAP